MINTNNRFAYVIFVLAVFQLRRREINQCCYSKRAAEIDPQLYFSVWIIEVSSYLSSADLLFSTNSLDDWSSFPTFTLVIPVEEALINITLINDQTKDNLD